MKQEDLQKQLIEATKQSASEKYGELVSNMTSPIVIESQMSFGERIMLTKERLSTTLVRKFLIDRAEEFDSYIASNSIESGFEGILNEPTNIINISDYL